LACVNAPFGALLARARRALVIFHRHVRIIHISDSRFPPAACVHKSGATWPRCHTPPCRTNTGAPLSTGPETATSSCCPRRCAGDRAARAGPFRRSGMPSMKRQGRDQPRRRVCPTIRRAFRSATRGLRWDKISKRHYFAARALSVGYFSNECGTIRGRRKIGVGPTARFGSKAVAIHGRQAEHLRSSRQVVVNLGDVVPRARQDLPRGLASG
jgi:hypothetical protein